jgi:epoxyqueuosine reductase
MNKERRNSLKSEIAEFLKERGAFKVRVANPLVGFQQAIEGCRPRDLMNNARSIVVFAVFIDQDYYRTIRVEGKTSEDNRIGNIFRDWLAYELADFLKTKGFNTLVPSGHLDRDRKIACFSFKMAAHEAGVGVFGKSGVVITPEYGPRVNIGVVVTDAILEPDEKLNFNPCQTCNVCVQVCPAKAIQALRNETGDDKFFCGYCYDKCPVGKTRKRGFTISSYKRLENLKPKERERLIRKVKA